MDVQYLIEHPRYMKPDTIHAIERSTGLDLFLRKPFLV